jgi:hypothetical protein
MSHGKMEQRPTGITLLAAFYIFCIPVVPFWGIILFVLGFGVGGASNPPLSFLGRLIVTSLLIAIIAVPVALLVIVYGLWTGKKWARFGTLFLCALNLAGMLLAPLWFGGLNELYRDIFLFDLLVQLAIIYYISTPKAKSYLNH